MIFDDYFDRVVIISLPNRKDRIKRAKDELLSKNLCENPRVFAGIHGDTVGVTAWFQWGGGAFGCMMSHIRVLESFLMDFNYKQNQKKTFENKKILILEDDVIFCDNAKELFEKYIKSLPENWGQFYLGGQHSFPPKLYNENILIGSSINRTHAYAVQGLAASRIYKHICFFPDYKGKNHHVDHQLEVAHRRGDWKTYCPKWWIAGQGENNSDISGRQLSNLWWDYRNDDDLLNLPVIISKDLPKFPDYCFCGDDGQNNLNNIKDLKGALFDLSSAAWDQRRLPFFRINDLSEETIDKIKLVRKGRVLIEENEQELINLTKDYSQWKS